MEYRVAIGPLALQLQSDGPWTSRLHNHLGAFQVAGEQDPPDLIWTHHRNRSSYRQVTLSTREVGAAYDDAILAHVYAWSRQDHRSLLRLVKRFPNIAYWSETRWLVFLRHAFELPVLAALESFHGYIPVHASTIVGPTGAVIILGSNGAGKSTLAFNAQRDLKLTFGSDNFTPCNGLVVSGFPGSPKPKPGQPPMPTVPSPHLTPVKGIVTAGFSTGRTQASRKAELYKYFDADREAHRNTPWQRTFRQAYEDTDANNRSVSDLLSRQPFIYHDWRTGSRSALDFIGECCGA